jgi:restriction system protein
MKMHENSLFAVLLRSPWWISIALAVGIGVLGRFALEKFSLPGIYAVFFGLPFFVIGCYAGWQQLRAPSAARVAAELDALRAMSWEAFSGALEAAYRSQGYAVAPAGVPGADMELSKAGRISLVSCKRWKAARTGIEPLRDLDAARKKAQAGECIYLAAGEVSANATAFAVEKGIRLLQGAELAALVKAPSQLRAA